jgi:WD40 repeat protein
MISILDPFGRLSGSQVGEASSCGGPPGRTLAVGHHGQTSHGIFLVAAGKELRQLRGHKDRITHVTFAPDGKRLTSVSGDSTALIWDVTA